MKKLIYVPLLAVVFAVLPYGAKAETVSFALMVNEASYGTLHRQSSNRGIPAPEFARWLAGNVEGVSRGSGGGKVSAGELTVLRFDGRGNITQQQTLTLRKSGGDKYPLPDRELMATMDRMFSNEVLFAYDAFFPQDVLIPGDTFFPGDTFVEGREEAVQALSSGASEQMQRATAGMDNPVGIALMLMPAENQLQRGMRVAPATVLFVADSRRIR